MGEENSNQPDLIPESDLKKPVFWRWFWCVLILLIVLVFWTIGSQFRTVPLRISKETTYFTEPLKPDGKSVDFLMAYEAKYYSDKIATEDNGYRLIVERLGPSSEFSPTQFLAICEKVGLDAEQVPNDQMFDESDQWFGRYYKSPEYDEAFIRQLDASSNGRTATEEPYAGRSYDQYDAKEVVEARMQLPWTLADLPMMRDWVSENESVVAVLREATQKPSFEIPFAQEDKIGLLMYQRIPEAGRMRIFGRLLSAHANYQIGVGNIEAAIDELIACKRLGRFMQNQSTFVHRLCGVAVEGLADSIGIAGSTKFQPSKEQLIRLANEIDAMPQPISPDRWLLFSRLEILDQIANFSQNTNIVELKGLKYFEEIEHLSSFGIDWNIVARVVNQRFDNLEIFFKDYRRPEIGFGDYLSRQNRSRYCGSTLIDLSIDAIIEADHRKVCQNRIQQIVLAMLLYEKDHGTLPPAFTVDGNGKTLHSWRVLILPYVGQQELYDQLKLDEPWDSPHNKKYWNADVPCYRCPSDSNASSGQTTYSVIVGAEAAFDGSEGKRLDLFGPTSGSLILVAERLKPIGWMDPTNEIPLSLADKGINVKDPSTGKKVSGLASEHPSVIQFGLRDGSVDYVSELIPRDVLEAMLRGKHFGRGQDY